MISDKTHPHPEPYEEPTYTKKWKGNAHVLRNPCNTEDIPYYAEASDNNTAYYIYADIPNGKAQDDDRIDITVYPKFTAQYKVRNQSLQSKIVQIAIHSQYICDCTKCLSLQNVSGEDSMPCEHYDNNAEKVQFSPVKSIDSC